VAGLGETRASTGNEVLYAAFFLKLFFKSNIYRMDIYIYVPNAARKSQVNTGRAIVVGQYAWNHGPIQDECFNGMKWKQIKHNGVV